MASREDWILRPVMAGCCNYESLKDGTLDLADVARMNDMLDVQEANIERMAKRGERS